MECVKEWRKVVDESRNHVPIVIDRACPRTCREANKELLYMAGDIGTVSEHCQCRVTLLNVNQPNIGVESRTKT